MKSAKRLVLLILVLCLAAISQLIPLIRLSMLINRLLPADYQDWDHPSINEDISNETISVCLLNNDDNHFLIEWLAFHYQTLPMRRLIIATDPGARTSPSEILQRWKPLMNITEWRDEDFFPLSYRRSILKSSRYPNVTDKLVLMHRYRQRFFYLRCMQKLQREHNLQVNSSIPAGQFSRRNWVAFIDVDEFLFPNRNWKRRYLFPSEHSGGVNTAQLLYRLQNTRNFQGPCIGIPRLLFGTKMDDYDDPRRLELDKSVYSMLVKEDSAISHILRNMVTWTWKWHGTLENTDMNKAGKALIDLSRVSPTDIQLEQVDVHRPIMSHCTNDQMWTSNMESPLVLHHYVGTMEQFTFRNDPREGRRTISAYLEYQAVNFSTIYPRDRYQWLLDFVETMGGEKAKMLLEGAGQVDKNAPLALPVETLFQNLSRVIFPVGMGVGVPLMRRSNFNSTNATLLLQ